MSIMPKQLEDDFKTCIDRVIESRYEDDKINCCIMDLKSKVLREMATSPNSDYAKCVEALKKQVEWNGWEEPYIADILKKHFA